MSISGKMMHLVFFDRKKFLFRASNEKVRSIQYELLTARTEVEQANEKVRKNIFLKFYTHSFFHS